MIIKITYILHRYIYKIYSFRSIRFVNRYIHILFDEMRISWKCGSLDACRLAWMHLNMLHSMCIYHCSMWIGLPWSARHGKWWHTKITAYHSNLCSAKGFWYACGMCTEFGGMGQWPNHRKSRSHAHTAYEFSRGTHLTDGKCIRANRLASNIAIAQYIFGCAGCAPSSHPLFVSIPFYYDWACRFIGTSAHKMPGQPWIASIYVQIQYIWVQNQSKPARECVNARTAMIIIKIYIYSMYITYLVMYVCAVLSWCTHAKRTKNAIDTIYPDKHVMHTHKHSCIIDVFVYKYVHVHGPQNIHYLCQVLADWLVGCCAWRSKTLNRFYFFCFFPSRFIFLWFVDHRVWQEYVYMFVHDYI